MCMHPGSGSCGTALSVNLIGSCRYLKAVVVYVLSFFSYGG